MDDTSIPFASCSDGKHIYASELTKVHLIQYIADMMYKGNKFKASQEICQRLTIPYNDLKN